jgi:hypothetical protein
MHVQIYSWSLNTLTPLIHWLIDIWVLRLLQAMSRPSVLCPLHRHRGQICLGKGNKHHRMSPTSQPNNMECGTSRHGVSPYSSGNFSANSARRVCLDVLYRRFHPILTLISLLMKTFWLWVWLSATVWSRNVICKVLLANFLFRLRIL